MKRSHLMGLLAIFCTTVFWGLSFISIKITVAVVPPMTMALLRFLIAAGILFCLLKKVEPGTKLDRRDVPLMALSGLLGVTAYYYFQNNGIKWTTASAASMIIAVIPVFTIVADFFVFKTKLSVLKVISVVLSVGGVYCIVVSPQHESSAGFIGNLFMIGAAVAWTVYTLTTKPLSKRYSQLGIVTYQTLFGTLALIPFALFESWTWQAINYSIVLHLIYLGVFCSALAYYLYVYALERLGISTVSLCLNIVPVISVLGGSRILQEPVSGLQIFGGAVILFSVYIANLQYGQNHSVHKMVEVADGNLVKRSGRENF